MIEALLAGLFGLLIGSFLNVCISRWPDEKSVVSPRSSCPKCGKLIRAWDNIPILSFVLLRGRCRDCGERISWRHPVVELLTAVSFGWFVASLGVTPVAAKYCLFAAMLIGLVFSDLETLLLPDEFTIGGWIIGIIGAWFIAVPDSTFHLINDLSRWHLSPHWLSVGEAVVGGGLPAGSLWFGGWLFEKVRKKEGLGFGDVKMIGMVGAFLGLRGCLLTIVLGSVIGSVIGLAYIKLAKKDASEYQLPFAVFLGVGAFVAAVEGQSMIRWYESTMWPQ